VLACFRLVRVAPISFWEPEPFPSRLNRVGAIDGRLTVNIIII
jgi:hypothetical protein